MATFAHLLALHAATSLARQQALAQLVGARPCRLDAHEGRLAFGDDLRFPAQVLGTHDEQDGTWLWGWADTASGLPASVLADAFALRNQGEGNGLRELAARGGPMDAARLRALAAVCRGLTSADAWYRVPAERGATLVLLRGLPARATARVPDGRIRPVLSTALSTFDVDPRQAAMYFLSQQGFGLEETPGGLVARRGTASRFTLEFGPDGRLARLVDAAQAARARPWWRLW